MKWGESVYIYFIIQDLLSEKAERKQLSLLWAGERACYLFKCWESQGLVQSIPSNPWNHLDFWATQTWARIRSKWRQQKVVLVVLYCIFCVTSGVLSTHVKRTESWSLADYSDISAEFAYFRWDVYSWSMLSSHQLKNLTSEFTSEVNWCGWVCIRCCRWDAALH